MPAKISKIGLMIPRVRGDAYSLKKIAVAKPNGRATIIAMALTMNVAVTNGQMPKSPIAGCQVVDEKNSIRLTSGVPKNPNASFSSTYTMPMVVKIEMIPATNRAPSMSVSLMRLCFDKSSGRCFASTTRGGSVSRATLPSMSKSSMM